MSQQVVEDGATITWAQDYRLDVSDRISTVTTSTGGVALSELTNYYDGSDDSLAWAATKTRADGVSAWEAA